MKLCRTSFGKSLLAVALGLSVTGCRESNAPDQGGTMLSGVSPQPIFAQIGEGLPLPADGSPPAPELSPGESTTPQATRLSPESVTPPPRVSPGVEEIIQLARAQMDDAVLLAFIENSPARFNLGADDILYLHDLGLSTEVIAAMIRHDASLPVPEWETPAAPVAAAATEPVAVAEPSGYAPPTAVAVSTGPAPAADTTVTQDYFYNALAPYGEWMELPDVGWCWRPTVAVVNTSWRPYAHGGRWIFTNAGWYWQSFYSWGWAPFHYGRWHRSGSFGWVWFPDTQWGPAWVSWRHCDGFFGWAPLPPGSHFVSGMGMTFHGSQVGFSFGFGLSSSCFTFVPVRYFCSPRPWNHCVPHGSVGPIYNNSTVINNYVQGNGNNTVINVGPGTGAVTAATRTEIQKVRIQEVSSGEPKLVRAESLSRDGSTLNVYRPRLPEQASQPPLEVTRRQQEIQRHASLVSNSEAAQVAVVRARSADRTIAPSLSTAPKTATGPSSAPRSISVGSSASTGRTGASRETMGRPGTAMGSRAEPQKASRAPEPARVANGREPMVSPRQPENRAVTPPQPVARPATPQSGWSSPTPRVEPLRTVPTTPAPARPATRVEPSRTMNPAFAVTPNPSPQLTPRPATGVPAPASPSVVAPRSVAPRSGPVAQPVSPRVVQPAPQPGPMRVAPSAGASVPSPSRAPVVVPSQGSGTVRSSPAPSPARAPSAPSSAPRSGGTRNR